MGKTTKKASIKTKRIMLGDNAQSFYDASTGIFIGRGETKELSVRQYSSPKIKKALTNGHLVIVTGDIPDLVEDQAEDLKAKFDTLMNQGMEVSKIAKAFTLPEIKVVAEQYEILADDDDTVESIVEAIINEIEVKE
ncbi:MAG: hypothetical protein NC131_06205 [Roseburia sp.]|nr:hypothetical protein [Roseburia sp.]